jgi:hypothetical protein
VRAEEVSDAGAARRVGRTRRRVAPLLVVLASACGRDPVAVEESVAAPAVLELGTFRADETRTLDVRVRNSSPRAWKLDRVSATCGCLRVLGHDAPHGVVPAGADVAVSLEVNTHGRFGLQQKEIRLHHDGSPEPERVRTRFVVTGPARCDPPVLVCAPSSDAGSFTASGVLHVCGRLDEVTAAVGECDPCVVVTLGAPRQDDDGVEVLVPFTVSGTAADEAGDRELRAELVARHTTGECERAPIRVTIQCEQSIEVVPPIVFVPCGRPCETTVRLVDHAGTEGTRDRDPWKVSVVPPDRGTVVESSDPDVARLAWQAPGLPGAIAWIEVTTAKKKRIARQLVVAIDD